MAMWRRAERRLHRRERARLSRAVRRSSIRALCLLVLPFLPLAPTGVWAQDAPPPAHVVRQRVTSLSLTLDPAPDEAAGDSGGGGGVAFELALFPDTSVTIVGDWIEHPSPDTTVLHGAVVGATDTQVTIAESDGIIAANIRWDGQHYQVRHTGDGQYAIEELDATGFAACLDHDEPPADGALTESTALNPDPTVALDSGSFVDVLVVYTPAARTAAGGTNSVNAIINLAVAETNTGLQHSEVDYQIRLVHTEEIAYAEGSGIGAFTTSLSRLRTNGDGYLDAAHTLRNIYGADQVVLLVHDPANSACGFGYVMTSPSNGFAAWAFSVVAWPCAAGNYSFGHELGHNWGAHHDRANAGGVGSYSYSYGYQQLAGPYRTIMAYNNGCGCVRLNHWSNPDVTHAGKPTGVNHLAANSADNRLTLNNNAIIAANWRAAVLPEPASGVTLTPDLPSPQYGGNAVSFTAVGDGGSGTYEYEFALQGPGTGNVMTVQQVYGAADTWMWGTTVADIGLSTIRVRVRNQGSAAAEEASTTLAYAVGVPPPPATGITLVPDQGSPALEGNLVTFTAAGSGGGGTYEYEFALEGPGTGNVMTVQQAYAPTATWTWDTVGHAGMNGVRVRVRNVGTQVAEDISTTIPFTVFPPVAGATLGASVASPQPTGTPITFTAAGQGGSGVYEYQFLRHPTGSSGWTVVRDYAAGTTWAWDSTGFTGEYVVMALVRNAGSTATFEAATGLTFSMEGVPDTGDDPVASATLAASPASPQQVGTAVTFTAGAVGGIDDYEFQFWHGAVGGGGWTQAQVYSPDATWTWDTTDQMGAHDIVVRVRNAGSAHSFDASARMRFEVQAPGNVGTSDTPATGVTLKPNVPSPQFTGTRVTFAAAGQGGTGAYEYEFALQGPATGDVMAVQQVYSDRDTWTWDTTGDAGEFTVRARVRTPGATVVEDASTMLTYAVQEPPPPEPASGVALSASPASPQPPGNTVTFTAQGTGGTGLYEYAFRAKPADAPTWTLLQAYAPVNALEWTTPEQDGTWDIRVDVRNQGSTAEAEATTTLSYTVATPPPPEVDVALTTDVASPQLAGSVVTLTAQGSGGAGSYEYEFQRKLSAAATWSLMQAYSPANVLAWDTTGQAGTWDLSVSVRTPGSTAPADASATLSFTVTGWDSPATQVTLMPDVSSPQAPGTAVTFTAQAGGGSGPYEYQFWQRPESGGVWTEVRGYAADSAWVWDTTGFAGAYVVLVYARTAGSTAALEASVAVEFLVQGDTGGDLRLAASVPSPQAAGTVVTWSSAGPDSGASYEYQFWVHGPGTGYQWEIAQAFSAADTWTWDTGGFGETHTVAVWVRDADAPDDASTTLRQATYVLTPDAAG